MKCLQSTPPRKNQKSNCARCLSAALASACDWFSSGEEASTTVYLMLHHSLWSSKRSTKGRTKCSSSRRVPANRHASPMITEFTTTQLALVKRSQRVGTCVASDTLRARVTPTLFAWRAFQGIIFFAYGLEEQTTEHFLREAFTSARRIRLLNPGTNITLITNPGLRPDIVGAFDLVRERLPITRFGQILPYIDEPKEVNLAQSKGAFRQAACNKKRTNRISFRAVGESLVCRPVLNTPLHVEWTPPPLT